VGLLEDHQIQKMFFDSFNSTESDLSLNLTSNSDVFMGDLKYLEGFDDFLDSL